MPHRDHRHPPGAPAPVFPPRPNLTLIGMPGSGKSIVGRIVASRLGWDFVDTDKLIEAAHGKPLQELVNGLGAVEFRRVEERAVLELAPPRPTVIATGGSVVYSEAAMEHLASLATLVFLDAPADVIRRHVDGEAPRGIVGMPEGGIEALHRERLPLYRRHATIVVRTSHEPPEEEAENVLAALRNAGVLPLHGGASPIP
ncbi:shikimate kinase [Geomonas sp. Red32]|uniref:shikimate kinase n=1 Tax=Geomonas sp. Red32 TaxID=2912856 RepID=UPI00202D0416|nr:shikimate kinase [Geomonas sp. Red32]MCM0080991.1 shikimate kinase [Geomonas sp. Red32]